MLLMLRLMQCKYLKSQQDNKADTLLTKVAMQEKEAGDQARVDGRLDGHCIISYKEELA